jgi:uncharacterized protein YndB with AHSA1/START domain
MHFVIRQRLEAPRPAVFGVISDPRQRLRWQSSLRSLQMRSEEPARLGTRWRETTKGGISFDLEITTFVAPQRWGESARGRFADAELMVDFQELADATLVIVNVTVSFKGALGALAPLVRVFMPLALSRDLARVTALARERAGSTLLKP